MGPGQKFPSHLVVNGRVPQKKGNEKESPAGKQTLEIPSFKIFNKLEEFYNRGDETGETEFVDHGNKNMKKILLDKTIEFRDLI